jgi:CubicO group peptidase (beta-lactamase class C family)
MIAFAVVAPPAGEPGLEPLLAANRVPGAAVAIIRDRDVKFVVGGVRDAADPARVTADTVFEAASLSKPVFAYAVLQLVDAGMLSLDTRLADVVPDFAADDPRAATITVRHVLTHTTGLPNWRGRDLPLRTFFPPGERFSYSGEGFVWLQRVVERVTGEPIDRLAEELVLRPLGMSRSGFVWDPAFDRDYASPHDERSAPHEKNKPAAGNAAYSLQTTARDYARFLQAVLAGARLKEDTARLWLAAQSPVLRDCVQCLSGNEAPLRTTPLAWGLGWGVSVYD